MFRRKALTRALPGHQSADKWGAWTNEDRPCASGSILTLSSHDPLRAVTVAEGNLQAAAVSASAATVNGPLTEKKLGSAMAQFWTRGTFTDGSWELRRRSASSVMISALSAKTIRPWGRTRLNPRSLASSAIITVNARWTSFMP